MVVDTNHKVFLRESYKHNLILVPISFMIIKQISSNRFNNKTTFFIYYKVTEHLLQNSGISFLYHNFLNDWNSFELSPFIKPSLKTLPNVNSFGNGFAQQGGRSPSHEI